MKLTTLIASASALVLVCAAGVSAAVLSQGAPEPTSQHKWLKTHVGTWDAKVSGSMGDSTGSNVIRSGPGDLWTVSDFNAPIMGAPFSGIELMGYDPTSDMFNSVWVDSVTNTSMGMTGKYDKAKLTLTMRGDSIGPDGSKVPMTNIYHYPDANNIVFKMNGPGEDGKDMTYMTIEYTRRK